MNQKSLDLGYCVGRLTAKVNSVDQWNTQMAILEDMGMTTPVRAYLESSGLIVKVLGADPKISSRENDRLERSIGNENFGTGIW